MPGANFRQLLSATAVSAEKPKPLPEGTYIANIVNFETLESGQKKTPGVKINFQLLQAQDDVDQEQLEIAGGAQAVSKRKIGTTFWLTPDSTYRLREFLEVACELELGERSFAELLSEIPNKQVIVALKQRETDKGDILLDVDAVLPLS